MLQPLTRFVQGFFPFRREQLFVGRGVGDGAGDRIAHGLEQTDNLRHLGGCQALNQFMGVLLGFGRRRGVPSASMYPSRR